MFLFFFFKLGGLIRLLAETTEDEQSKWMGFVICEVQEQQAGVCPVHFSILSTKPHPLYNADIQ